MARKSLVANAADEGQVENAKREEKNARELWLDDLAGHLATVPGRRLLWAILEHCAPFQTPFSVDDRTTNHAIGQSDVGRWLIREIASANPHAFVQMMTEFGTPGEP